ncbi:TonB-dependent receptor domain-containing protein [Silanimonas lenta]|uniref:TonB-dependent receptor domain-containing protein n=1 Tax=Silanimonas lenta TaxID=265429 RepID=UPI000414DF33|nr:TonB-dependent receptor [Silanimonas lenta]
MRNTTPHLKRSALTQATLAGLALLVAMPVLAQSETTDEEKKKEEERVTQIEAVQVTGSRIFRAGFDTLEPATVVTREKIEQRGITNIADALNEIPGFGTGVTPEGGQSTFGVGVNFVNRLGLGTNRTLSLINGRRVVTSNPGTIFGPAAPGVQVDLNAIPAQLVERIENIAIGGAPTYGSDAIAGVVNVITRRDYEGAEVSATYGITDRDDNQRKSLSAIFGQNFGNGFGNITLSATYDTSDGVLGISRPRIANAYLFAPNPCTTGPSSITTTQPNRTPANDGRVNPNIPFQTCTPTAASDGIPNNVLIRDRRIFQMTFGGIILPATGAFNLPDGRLRGFGASQTTYFQFAPNGNLVAYNPGINFGTQSASGGDGLNLAESVQLLSDLDRRTVNLMSSMNLTENTRLFFEGFQYTADSLELVDQYNWNSITFTGLSGPITFRSDYPLLNQQARDVLAANGITSFRLSRAHRDLVENNASSGVITRRAVFGADGNIAIGDRDFRWEASYTYGRNSSEYYSRQIDQQRFVNALNVAVVNGRVVCSTTPTPGLIIPGGITTPVADPNCVPLNLFGEGAPGQAARDYVTVDLVARAAQEQEVFNANIGGALFDMWGGAFSANAGIERRIERADFQPDAFQRAGRGRSVAILPLTGSFATKEAFVEFFAPFVDSNAGLPMLNRLDFTGKFRRVDNTVNGGFNAYTYGLQYRPVEDIEFRGNFTRSLRAPSLVELFTPVSSAFSAFPDPCHAPNQASGTRPAVRQANCNALFQSLGINGNTFLSNAVTATIPITSQGDANLLNESSDAWTYGIVLQPRWVQGLRLAVDYYKVEITNVIGNLGTADIATGCYDNTNFNTADPANGNTFCSRIRRDANGQVTFVQTGFVNGGYLNFRGFSGEISYVKDLADWGFGPGGTISFTGTAFRRVAVDSSINNVVNTNSNGLVGTPLREYQFGVAYDHDRWGMSVQGNYQGPVNAGNNISPELQDILVYDSYKSYDAGAYVNFLDKRLRVRFAVTNFTDVEPPFPLGGIGTYDILGRRYTLSAVYKF